MPTWSGSPLPHPPCASRSADPDAALSIQRKPRNHESTKSIDRFRVLVFSWPSLDRHLIVIDLIRSRKARIGVIELGYVGLPLAGEFARAGFDTTGFDVDAAKISQINAGKSYIPDVPDADLCAAVKAG